MLRMMLLLASMLTAVLAGIDRAGATPPPPDQIAANCDSPTYASDVLVCADSSLLALDREMRDKLAAGRPESGIAPRALVEAQDAWFRRRSLCAFSERHAACLRTAYAERIAVLDALRLAASSQRRQVFSAICSGAPWAGGTVRIHAPGPGPLTIEDAEGRVLVVATDVEPRDDWSPFVRFVIQRNTIRLQPLGRSPIICEPGNRL